MEKIIKNVLYVLFYCCFFPNFLCSQNLSGFFYSEEEVKIWKKRALEGPYKISGDVTSNSPGEWIRIVNNANHFIANPASEHYKGPNKDAQNRPTDIVVQWSHPEAFALGTNLRDAAFVYLITREEKYKNAVYNALLIQSKEPLTDFSNIKRWPTVYDINPGFDIAEWVSRLLVAYDMIDISDPVIDKFFKNAGQYCFRNIESLNDGYYDRERGIVKVVDNSKDVTHIGGFKIPSLGKWYNNRRATIERAIAMIGFKYNNKAYIKECSMFFKEFVKYSIFPDGTFSEFHRATATNPEKGFAYSTASCNILIEIADLYARNGDTSLYDYVTSDGVGESKGGSKSLKLMIINLCKHIDGTYKRYIGGTSPDYLIDGKYKNKWTSENDIWFCQANLYYKDPYIKSIYSKPLVANPAPTGPLPVWGGTGGLFPGKLFMYGQMEGLVNPFSPNPVVKNNPPIVSAGPDKSVDKDVKSLTLVGSASDDGSIVSTIWTKASGPDVVIRNEKTLGLELTGLREGIYKFVLTVIDNHGASSSDEVIVNVGKIALPQVFAGNDTTISEKTRSLTIEGKVTNVKGDIIFYKWTKVSGNAVQLINENTSKLTIAGYSQGTYKFRLTVVDGSKNSVSDEILIKVIDGELENILPHVSLGEDRIVSLSTSSVILTAKANDPDGTIEKYNWTKESGPDLTYKNENTSSLLLSDLKEGQYIFRVTVTDNSGGVSFDEILIKVVSLPLEVVLITTRNACYGLNNGFAEVKGRGGYPPYLIQWSNRKEGGQQTDLAPGKYRVLIKDSRGNESGLDITIGQDTKLEISAMSTFETSQGGDGGIDISVLGGVRPYLYNWSNGTTVEDLENISAGEYKVTVVDANGCSISKDIVVSKEGKNSVIATTKVSPRKIFSPNGDGIGDETWVVENVEEINGCNLTIFNESGKEIFQTLSYSNTWNGTVNGQPVPEGAYFYLITCPETKSTMTGSMRLVR